MKFLVPSSNPVIDMDTKGALQSITALTVFLVQGKDTRIKRALRASLLNKLIPQLTEPQIRRIDSPISPTIKLALVSGTHL